MTQIISTNPTVTPDISQSTSSSLINRRDIWNDYLEREYNNYLNSNIIQTHRLEIAELFHQYKFSGYTLFHLTATYFHLERVIKPEPIINSYFTNFYLYSLLPYLFNTNRCTKSVFRPYQPICYCFVDEHESKAIPTRFKSTGTGSNASIYEFPERLHHHAVISVHPTTVNRMRSLIGIDTLTAKSTHRLSRRITTSDVTECDTSAVLYASKLMRKYPEFLLFSSKVDPSDVPPDASVDPKSPRRSSTVTSECA